MPVPRASASPRRSPRSQAEIQRLLLRCARERFAAHGYGGASTKKIAEDAEVSERLIFSYFGSKEGLFDAAVLDPFEEFIADYTQRWRTIPRSADFEAETRAYLSGLHDLFSRHRVLVRAMISASQAPGPDARGCRVAAAFASLLRPIEAVVAEEVTDRGMTRFNGPLLTRAFLGMMMSIVALDDLFFGDSRPVPERDAIVDQLTTLFVHGYGGFRP
jgi:AcrR family transcriptional regulator